MPTGAEPSFNQTVNCELCIVGAGYAGLNGLNVAAKYLKPGDRVVVIDKNATWGGQWLDQYDFVRLHQPYRMFTAGDQPWQLKRDPSYLATRREVIDHLATVPRVSAGQLEIEPFFGHVYRGHRLREGRAEVDIAPVAGGPNAQPTIRIRARRLLKATGADIECLPPFQLSSTRVRSVGVSDPVLMTREFLESNAPIYIIGSGKTAMDCARYFTQTTHAPRRQVNILAGSGMWFFVRDSFYPRGRHRYTRGVLTGDFVLQMAQSFDGQNEAELMQHFEREGFAANVFGYGGNCRLGILSLAERDEILRGVNEVHRGHLVDVVGTRTRMILREGQQQREVPVAEGAWFINCTGHLRHIPHEPILQDSGVVCAPQLAFGFTGTSVYYIAHLWYRDELPAIAAELFRARLDVEPKLRFAPQFALMAMANAALMGTRLPLAISSRFQGDFNKWYPLHRQVAMAMRMLGSRKALLDKAERLLNQRFSDCPDAA